MIKKQNINKVINSCDITLHKINKKTNLFTDEFLNFHLGKDINHKNNLELFKKIKKLLKN